MKTKPGMAAAVGAWSARHRKTAVFGWLLFVVLAAFLGGLHGSTQVDEAEAMPGQVSRAAQILDRAGLKSPSTETVLIQSTDRTADAPAFRAVVDQVIAGVNGTGRATDVRSPYDTRAVSADGRSALVQLTVRGDHDEATANVGAVVDAVAAVQKQHPDLTVVELGDASSGKWMDEQFADDFARAEWTAVPLALGILLVAFGALVAAVLPVLLAITAFVAAGGLVALSSGILHTSNSASSVMLLVGLAVGVDYCLFYLRREREERAAGRDLDTALRIAAATSGRAVLVSGVTVVIAMAGMFLTGIAEFKAMAYATIVVVVTAVLGSLTVLPALLSMLGDRVDKGRVPFLHAAPAPRHRQHRRPVLERRAHPGAAPPAGRRRPVRRRADRPGRTAAHHAHRQPDLPAAAAEGQRAGRGLAEDRGGLPRQPRARLRGDQGHRHRLPRDDRRDRRPQGPRPGLRPDARTGRRHRPPRAERRHRRHPAQRQRQRRGQQRRPAHPARGPRARHRARGARHRGPGHRPHRRLPTTSTPR